MREVHLNFRIRQGDNYTAVVGSNSGEQFDHAVDNLKKAGEFVKKQVDDAIKKIDVDEEKK